MKRFWLLTGLILACLSGLFLVVQALGVPVLADPSPWLQRGGLLAGLLGVGLLVGDMLLPVPSSLVMMAHGALFGVLVGAILSLIGNAGGALLGFAIGRRGGPLMARLVPADERERVDRLLQRWGALAVAVTRPVPLLADTAAVLAGASPLGWRRVALAATLGAFPPALLYAIAGATAITFHNTALMFGLVILIAAAFWFLGRWAERLLTRRAGQDS